MQCLQKNFKIKSCIKKLNQYNFKLRLKKSAFSTKKLFVEKLMIYIVLVIL